MVVSQTKPVDLNFLSEVTPGSNVSPGRRLRVRQMQFFSRWIRGLSSISELFAIIKLLRQTPGFRQVLEALVGYNRPYAKLADAQAAIARYEGDGHSDPACAVNLMRTLGDVTGSDYAALFFLGRLAPKLKTVFDFGGSVGNMFYSYDRFLEFRPDVRWIVHDLPSNVELGRRIAQAHGEERLAFTTRLEDAAGVDLFFACGVVHYFEQPLYDTLEELESKPRFVLINRSPMVDTGPFATVQDGGVYRVACKLYNRRDLIAGMEQIGYTLVQDWYAPERSLIIPAYPDRSVSAYSGMFFELQRDGQRRCF